MNTSELLEIQFQTLQRHFSFTLKDLTLDQLLWQPTINANSISFLLWHVLRAWDRYFSMLAGSQELYDVDGWPRKFGFDVSDKGIEGISIGTGFSPEDAALVKAESDVLIAYLEALFDQLQHFLRSATNEELGRPFIIPWWPAPSTVAGVLSHVMTHGMEHIGQAQYVLGLMPVTP